MMDMAKIKPEPFVLDLHGAFVRRTDLRGANLTNAILRGADLTGARNLTAERLAEAVIDDAAVLPAYLAGKLVPSSVSGPD